MTNNKDIKESNIQKHNSAWVATTTKSHINSLIGDDDNTDNSNDRDLVLIHNTHIARNRPPPRRIAARASTQATLPERRVAQSSGAKGPRAPTSRWTHT